MRLCFPGKNGGWLSPSDVAILLSRIISRVKERSAPSRKKILDFVASVPAIETRNIRNNTHGTYINSVPICTEALTHTF